MSLALWTLYWQTLVVGFISKGLSAKQRTHVPVYWCRWYRWEMWTCRGNSLSKSHTMKKLIHWSFCNDFHLVCSTVWLWKSQTGRQMDGTWTGIDEGDCPLCPHTYIFIFLLYLGQIVYIVTIYNVYCQKPICCWFWRNKVLKLNWWGEIHCD